MTGAWLVAMAMRVVHPRTFRMVIAPAIADLQQEATAHVSWHMLRAHAGVWRAIVGGVWLELREHGLNSKCGGAASVVAALALIQGAYNLAFLAFSIDVSDGGPSNFGEVMISIGSSPSAAALLGGILLGAAVLVALFLHDEVRGRSASID